MADWSPWLVFLLSAGAVVAAGSRLSRDGDVIAERTGLGGAWIGAVLVAGATSLPELATDLFAVRMGERSLAVGDLFGSCMANILILGVADLMTKQVQVLSRVTVNQAMVGTVAILLLGTAILGILTPSGTLLGCGWATPLLGLSYLAGMRLLHVNKGEGVFESAADLVAHSSEGPSLRTATIGFIASAGVILFSARFLASSAAAIAESLGMGSGIVGMVLLALTTSLPELTVTLTAMRTGSYDLAVGNLLGSNCFNVAILFVLDVADGPTSLLGGLEPGLIVGAVAAVLLTGQAVLGVLHRGERRVWCLEPDAVLMILTYFGGIYLTYRATPAHAPTPPSAPPPSHTGAAASPPPERPPSPLRSPITPVRAETGRPSSPSRASPGKVVPPKPPQPRPAPSAPGR